MNELKIEPCAYCFSENTTIEVIDHKYYVRCDDCLASSILCERPVESIYKWNRIYYAVDLYSSDKVFNRRKKK